MLENPSSDVLADAALKRYAPPNQRNRSLGRRKSGGGNFIKCIDQPGWLNGAIKIGLIADQGHVQGNNCANESLNVKLIPLHGCCNSEAFQLLNNRWAAAMNARNSLPEDSAERPVVYTRKFSSAWGHTILPHMLFQPTCGTSTGLQRDFLSELRQAIHNSNSCPNP